MCPPTRRLRAHHSINLYSGARRQNETEMFSDHEEMSPSIAAVIAPSTACSMLAVQQQKSQFVDVSTGGCLKLGYIVLEGVQIPKRVLCCKPATLFITHSPQPFFYRDTAVVDTEY